MPALSLDAAELSHVILRMWWPVLRIGGFVAAAPIVSSSAVPARVKIALTLGLTLALAPLAHVPANLAIFSAPGLFAAVQDLVIGVSIGMVVQLMFEALALAGQTTSMTMGLGFATLVDPQHGANTTVVGQLFTVFATLAYLAVSGHLVLLGALAASFESLPIGAAQVGGNLMLAVASWGGRVFETGLLIAMPAVIALVIVNLALGVVTRAAPQLNLFGVGFPLTMLAGLLVLFVGSDGIMFGISSLMQSALSAATALATRASGGVP
jgi:flagellar biosynthetic protein FliR